MQNIRNHGGEIVRNCKVEKIHVEDDKVSYVETDKGRRIYGKKFISNVHPARHWK
ncbi:MAG: hypothetical protein WDO19_07195 [Bacteroidota bacterium]